MKLGKFEKLFVNSEWNKKKTLRLAEKLLSFIGLKERRYPDFLEVGCGNGAVSKYFAQRYHFNATGIDADPEQIELAQKDISEIADVKFLTADATHLLFEDNSFDIVLSFEVMHHISNWLDALKEIQRVLKPKGYFIYADIVYPELIAKIGKSFKHNYGVVTISDLHSFIEQNDFSTIYASLSKSLIWNHYEAVYQKGQQISESIA